MGITAFLLFIVACLAVLFWVSRKSGAERELEQRRLKAKLARDRERKARAEKLAHQHDLWQSRRHKPHHKVVTAEGQPRWDASEELEYDGYSRRDRHLARRKASRIKEKDDADRHAAGEPLDPSSA